MLKIRFYNRHKLDKLVDSHLPSETFGMKMMYAVYMQQLKHENLPALT